MTSVEPLVILSAAESPPLNILVMCANSHFCLVCLNWASVTHHKRNPDRYTPRHGIFHKKQVPAGLLAEWGQVTTGIVTSHTSGHESLALPAATLTVPDPLLLGKALALGLFSRQRPHYMGLQVSQLLWMEHAYISCVAFAAQ